MTITAPFRTWFHQTWVFRASKKRHLGPVICASGWGSPICAYSTINTISTPHVDLYTLPAVYSFPLGSLVYLNDAVDLAIRMLMALPIVLILGFYVDCGKEGVPRIYRR